MGRSSESVPDSKYLIWNQCRSKARVRHTIVKLDERNCTDLWFSTWSKRTETFLGIWAFFLDLTFDLDYIDLRIWLSRRISWFFFFAGVAKMKLWRSDNSVTLIFHYNECHEIVTRRYWHFWFISVSILLSDLNNYCKASLFRGNYFQIIIFKISK